MAVLVVVDFNFLVVTPNLVTPLVVNLALTSCFEVILVALDALPADLVIVVAN